jgi:DNA-binding transcriptional MerR regulator
MRVIDVARRFSVGGSFIRKLERLGLIPVAPRDLNNHRRYTPELLDAIQKVLYPDNIERSKTGLNERRES